MEESRDMEQKLIRSEHDPLKPSPSRTDSKK